MSCPSHVVRSGGRVPQRPYARAWAASRSAPRRSPTSAKVTLHDSSKASINVICDEPPLQWSSPKFWSCSLVSGSVSRCGFFHGLSGPNPFSSAADAVTILKLEPGRKSSW